MRFEEGTDLGRSNIIKTAKRVEKIGGDKTWLISDSRLGNEPSPWRRFKLPPLFSTQTRL